MNILCVCSGNTCRSPMMQILLQAAMVNAKHPSVIVSSAGTTAATNDSASSGARRAMARRGLSLDNHTSRNLNDIDLTAFDAIFCMTATHAAVVRTRGNSPTSVYIINETGGGVPDPWGGDDDDYESTAQVLEMAAREIAQEL